MGLSHAVLLIPRDCQSRPGWVSPCCHDQDAPAADSKSKLVSTQEGGDSKFSCGEVINLDCTLERLPQNGVKPPPKYEMIQHFSVIYQ